MKKFLKCTFTNESAYNNDSMYQENHVSFMLTKVNSLQSRKSWF